MESLSGNKRNIIAFVLTVLFSLNIGVAQNSWLSVPIEFDNFGPRVIYEDSLSNKLFIGGSFRKVNKIKCNSVISVDSKWNVNYLDTMSIVADPPTSILMYNGELLVGGFGGLFKYENNKWNQVFYSSAYIMSEMLEFDSDLYVGGTFENVISNNDGALLTINNQDTLPFPGIDTVLNVQNDFINSLVEYKNELVIAADFKYPGINDIATYNATGWNTMNGGLKGFDVYIGDMEVFQGELYVAGVFNKQAGSQANYIMKWNGTTWSELHGGIVGIQVHDIHVFENKLWVAGNFTKAGGLSVQHIAVWDGIKWCKPIGGFDDQTICLGEFQDSLYVGGAFWSVDGDSSIAHLAKLNSSIKLECDPTVGETEQILASLDVEIVIIPNPSNGQFTIKFDSPFKGELIVYDMLGSSVHSDFISNNTSIEVSLSQQLSKGVYLVQFIGDDGTRSSQRIVVTNED